MLTQNCKTYFVDLGLVCNLLVIKLSILILKKNPNKDMTSCLCSSSMYLKFSQTLKGNLTGKNNHFFIV